MQFADLMQLFREGQNEGRKRGYVSQGACDAEGIAAVIRALRDEFTKLGTLEFQDSWAVLRKFNEILGDAGEKVAGSSAREGEADGELRTPSARSPATAPAPAVCEITAERDRLMSALEAIQHSQLKRKVAHPARTDGKRSVYDLCEHKVMMKDTCEDCIQDFARKALGGDA